MGRIRIAIAAFAVIAATGGSGRSSIALEPKLESAVQRNLVRVSVAERDPLLPIPSPATPESAPEERRTFAIARSIQTVEAGMDTSLAVLNGDVLPLLSLARNYRHLGLRERALVWYERAQIADRDLDYRKTLAEEISRCTVELADSARSMDLLEDFLEDGRASISPLAVTNLLHSVADLELGKEVEGLVSKVEGIGSRNSTLRLELARFRLRSGDAKQAREHYAAVLLSSTRPPLREAAEALRGLADSTLRAGNTKSAASLYELYRAGDAGRLSAWSTYQLGSLAAASNDIEVATANFRSICERADATPWRDEACARLEQMRQIAEIDDELRPFGRSLRE